MSDSVDRVFVHALATVRRLPRTGSSRPPPAARLQLYGLYKQSMEGDVSSILPRPTLPPQSPNPNDSNNQANNSVHRYASRDLRTREAQAEIEKWDAWHACAGMSRTEAKRRYITTLIETMKEYASGTSESRELVAELEFVWNQIRSQSGSDESEEGESPTRRLERAGMKQTGILGRGDGGGGGGGGGSSRSLGRNASPAAIETSIFSRIDSSGSRGGRDSGVIVDPSRDQTRNRNHGLRVLSPTSQRGSDDIIENEELPEPIPEPDDDEEYASASEDPSAKPKSKSIPMPSPSASPPPHSHSHSHPPPGTSDTWRTQIESHLRHLTTELAALREQLSSHNLLSRSSFSLPLPSHLSLRKRVLLRASLWLRWLFWTTMRQAVIQLGILAVVLVWGRIRGDRTVEIWVRERISEFWSWTRFVARRVRDRDGNLVRGLAAGQVRVS